MQIIKNSKYLHVYGKDSQRLKPQKPNKPNSNSISKDFWLWYNQNQNQLEPG